MAIPCGICSTADSKYKCPTCELRYCSLACYKPHKAAHEASAHLNPQQTAPPTTRPKQDRPGTKQRTAKPDFATLTNDPELRRLLTRYPTLYAQLGALYALTLDPGPAHKYGWNKSHLPALERPGGFRGRGRGRGRGGRGGRGGFGGEEPRDRQHGLWNKDKGDKEALSVLEGMKGGAGEDERAEGVREFVRLVGLRFGEGVVEGGDEDGDGDVRMR